MNWSEERFSKLKRILDLWKCRHLTYKGKIVILKTFILSRLVYTANVINCPPDMLKKLEKLMFDFLWGSPAARVRKSDVVKDISNGGLNMIDLKTYFDSINLKWVCKLMDDSKGKWKCFFEYWLETLGGVNILINSRCDPKYVLKKELLLPKFYCNLLYTYFLYREMSYMKHNNILNDSKDVCKEVIWLNTHLRHFGKMLLFKNWIKSNIIFVGDIVDKNGIMPMSKIKEKMVVYDAQFFSEYAKCCYAINRIWSKKLRNNDLNGFIDYKNKTLTEGEYTFFEQNMSLSPTTSTKQIYKELQKLQISESRATLFWANIFRIKNSDINWQNLWKFKLHTVQDNTLVQFNFRFMYNILITPDNLFKWRKKDTNRCSLCAEIGTISHMFYYCITLCPFWKYIENVIRKFSYDNSFTLKPQMMIYGFDYTKNNLVDLIIHYALLSIYRCSMLFVQNEVSTNELKSMFKIVIRKRFHIEKNKKKQRLFTDITDWERLMNVLQ